MTTAEYWLCEGWQGDEEPTVELQVSDIDILWSEDLAYGSDPILPPPPPRPREPVRTYTDGAVTVEIPLPRACTGNKQW